MLKKSTKNTIISWWNGSFVERVSVDYINNYGFKGKVHSRPYPEKTDFYASTDSQGNTFSTFKRADKFMKGLGYYPI